MRDIFLQLARDYAMAWRARRRGVLAFTILALCGPVCANELAATPKISSIEGNGISSATDNPDILQFRFDPPAWNASAQAYTSSIGTTIRFIVPYPASIELEINGKRLTRAEPPLSRNYQYTSSIENAGADPVMWNVEILTPFDVPYAEARGGQAAYVLRIVNVAGPNRSDPLEIQYRQPRTYILQGLPGASSPPAIPKLSATCLDSVQDRAFQDCWMKSGESPYGAAQSTCGYSQSVRLLSNFFPGFRSEPGPC